MDSPTRSSVRTKSGSWELDFIGLANEVLGTDEVGLVVLNRAPLAMAEMVLRDARVLMSRDEARRVDYEQRVHHQYLDLRHYLKAYDRELFRQVAAWADT